MMENNFKGIWKLKDGHTIVQITGKAHSTMEGNHIYGWYGILNNMITFWDDNGKHMKYPEFDLMTRGVESYGKVIFK